MLGKPYDHVWSQSPLQYNGGMKLFKPFKYDILGIREVMDIKCLINRKSQP